MVDDNGNGHKKTIEERQAEAEAEYKAAKAKMLEFYNWSITHEEEIDFIKTESDGIVEFIMAGSNNSVVFAIFPDLVMDLITLMIWGFYLGRTTVSKEVKE